MFCTLFLPRFSFLATFSSACWAALTFSPPCSSPPTTLCIFHLRIALFILKKLINEGKLHCEFEGAHFFRPRLQVLDAGLRRLDDASASGGLLYHSIHKPLERHFHSHLALYHPYIFSFWLQYLKVPPDATTAVAIEIYCALVGA